MSLITMQQALKYSVAEKYALPALVADGHIFLEGIVKAAEEKKRPLIVMLPGLLFDMPDFDKLATYMVNRIADSPVPMVLHLDHGADKKTVIQAIRYGFSSVMIDASMLPFEENLRITQEVVALAHDCGVSVEAEIGHVASPHHSIESSSGGEEGVLTRPEEAAEFARRSGVDALAIAIGTVHGIYHEEPKIDFERIAAVRSMIDTPLVMHGSSGLADEVMIQAVAAGINKVNFFTSMSLDAARACRAEMERNPDTIFLHDYIRAAERNISDTVCHLLNILSTKPAR